MHNPQGNFIESTIGFGVPTAAHGDGGSDVIGIGTHEIDGAVATQAHSEDIDPVGVDGVVVLDKFQVLENLFRLPGSARILGGEYNGIYLSSHLYRMQWSIATHLVEILAAKTVAVKENHKRLKFVLLHYLLGWCIYPKVVTALNGVVVRFQLLSKGNMKR